MRPLLAACLIALIGCATTEQTSSTAGGWSTQYSKNVTLTQSTGGFTFTFPTKDGVHYIVKSASKVSGSITATFVVTGGKFVAAGGGKPRVGIYFQRKGDDMQALKGTTEFYRWWSNPQAVRLVPEIVKNNHVFVLNAPLTPRFWSSVYGTFGDKNVKMFNAAKSDMAVVGFSFGDDFGFGHGVWSVGKATFTLTKFTP